jgi:ribonuclease I
MDDAEAWAEFVELAKLRRLVYVFLLVWQSKFCQQMDQDRLKQVILLFGYA